jgi:dihydrofolate reductase
MPGIVYIATSLDGYIARKNGNLDWLMERPNPENSDYGFSEFMERIDGILMGRNTFETIVAFGQWPYTKPVFVLSSKLNRVPDDYLEKASIVSGDPKEIIQDLKNKGIEKLYIDGGKTIQSFLKQDLIDELIITRVPIILGSGIPLFTDMDQEMKFRLKDTEILNEDLVKSTYTRIRP